MIQTRLILLYCLYLYPHILPLSSGPVSSAMTSNQRFGFDGVLSKINNPADVVQVAKIPPVSTGILPLMTNLTSSSFSSSSSSLLSSTMLKKTTEKTINNSAKTSSASAVVGAPTTTTTTTFPKVTTTTTATTITITCTLAATLIRSSNFVPKVTSEHPFTSIQFVSQRKPSTTTKAISKTLPSPLLHRTSILTSPFPPTKCNPYVVGEGGNTFLGKSRFGLEPKCLPSMKMDGDDWCFLTNDVVTVRNAKQNPMTSFNKWGFPIVSFPCSQGPSDSVNGGFSPSLDAFRYINSAIDMLQEWFQFSIREKSVFEIFTHVGKDWNNAGIMTTPLSFLNFHNKKVSTLALTIFLGDGKPKQRSASINKPGKETKFIHPFTTPNAIGHEVGHVLIWITSSKIALNTDAFALVEAFADMTGEILEFYVTSFVDWVTHSGLNVGPHNQRSFSRSINSRKDRLTLTSRNRRLSRLDNIYERGNIFRHVFFHIAQKSGIRKAFMIFLDSVRVHWSRQKTWSFEMAACGVLKAATDGNDVHSDDVKHYFEIFDIHVNNTFCRKYWI